MLLRRVFATLLRAWLVVLLALAPATALGDAPPRTGVTLAPPPVAKEPAIEEHSSPGDAPIAGSGAHARPPIPAGYGSFEPRQWLRFSYPPELRHQVETLAEQAPATKEELSAMLGQPVLDDVDVRVARTPGEMADLAPAGAPFPKYAAGVAYSDMGLVLLTVQPIHANANHDLAEVFRHELTHVALHDALGGARVPRWLNEGFAVYASGEGSAKRLQTLWTATLANNFQSLAALERTFPASPVDAEVAYAQAADVVRFLLRREDRARFASMVARMHGKPGVDGQAFEAALKDSYGTDITTLEYQWREDVARRYTFWPVLFSGTFIWAGVISLFLFAWRRRRKRTQDTLDRWAVEEAREDELRHIRAQLGDAPRVHIVLTRGGRPPEPQAINVPVPEAPEIPKVEHDGGWHTLH